MDHCGDSVVGQPVEIARIERVTVLGAPDVVAYNERLWIRDVRDHDQREGGSRGTAEEPAPGTADAGVAHREHREQQTHPDRGANDREAEHRQAEGGVVERHAAQAHDDEPDCQQRNHAGKHPHRDMGVHAGSCETAHDGEKRDEKRGGPAELEEPAAGVFRGRQAGVEDESMAGVAERDELGDGEQRENHDGQAQHDDDFHGPEPARASHGLRVAERGGPRGEHEHGEQREQRDVADDRLGMQVRNDHALEDRVGRCEERDDDREYRDRDGRGARDGCAVPSQTSTRHRRQPAQHDRADDRPSDGGCGPTDDGHQRGVAQGARTREGNSESDQRQDRGDVRDGQPRTRSHNEKGGRKDGRNCETSSRGAFDATVRNQEGDDEHDAERHDRVVHTAAHADVERDPRAERENNQREGR